MNKQITLQNYLSITDKVDDIKHDNNIKDTNVITTGTTLRNFDNDSKYFAIQWAPLNGITDNGIG